MESSEFLKRLQRLAGEVELGMECVVKIGRDTIRIDSKTSAAGRYYFQIACYRRDVITGEMGWGYGGKAYLSEHSTDSELLQVIFGLYKGYWEHEARENFMWRGRRIFGPHISSEALWEIARRVDYRSAHHVEDQPAPVLEGQTRMGGTHMCGKRWRSADGKDRVCQQSFGVHAREKEVIHRDGSWWITDDALNSGEYSQDTIRHITDEPLPVHRTVTEEERHGRG